VRILVAPQEYKGTLTAVDSAGAIASGLRASLPGAEIDLLPLADGGPGTAEALLAAAGGERRSNAAHDPLMRPIVADWALLSSGVAVIECAAASGFLRLRPEELDARLATTYGTGEMIAAALDDGAESLIIGLGGSATNDGGAGMAQALGFRLLDAAGAPLPPGGAALARLARIETGGAHSAIAAAHVLAAADVTNPLCGPEGASAVYGPQKGADAAAVAELDAALARFAAVVERDLGIAVRDLPGCGAAGGLGAGVVAFLHGEVRPGAALVAAAAGFEERLRAADFVITGEGCLDGQTGFGKAPQYVAQKARDAGRPVICVPGALGPGHERLSALFDVIEAASEPGGVLLTGREAAQRLAAAVRRAVLRLGLGSGLL